MAKASYKKMVTRLRPLGVAMLAVAAAVVLRLALEPLLAHTHGWLTFWPAVIVAAWFGGWRAGLAAIVGSLVAVALWIYPHSDYTSVAAITGAAVFALSGFFLAYASDVLHRSRAAEQRQRHAADAARARLRSLVDLATVLASADTLDAVANAVISQGKRASNADTTGLYIVDDETARLELAGTVGSAPELVEQLRQVRLDSPHGKRLCKEHWVENQAQFRATMPDLADIPVATRKAQAFWSIPLIAEGRTRGVLTMGFFEPREFSAEEREFARLFAQHCSEAIARAERSNRLDRERKRLDRMVDANLIGTVFWQRPGYILRANDSFLRALGYTREDLDAGRVDWRTLTPADHAAADAAAVAAVRAQGYHEPYEKEFVHKDGHRVPVLVSSASFFDDPEKGVTYVADLTEVKRVAEAANRAKDEFLAMLGHELRNPLAPIMTALELIELRGVEVSDRALGIVRRQTLHLTRMVDDLLDVARIRAGKLQLRRRRTEIGDIVRGAFETATPLLQSRGHKVIVDVPATGLVVDVDPTRIGQVLSNILTNSAKYTEPGGTVAVVATSDASHVTIQVTDTGVGIAPELLPTVFELFTQEPQNVDRSRGGLGLGLALARTFIDLHGGTISAHSDGRGKGTRITVKLPLAAAAERPALAQAPSAMPRSSGARRVLVVDDNSDAADMLAVLAEHRGHVAKRVNDGASALRMIVEFKPDVALLDLGLPAMDGFELAERIRRIPELGRIRLVAVTGYGLQSDRERSRAAGFDLHLVKPLEVQDVIRAIEDATPSDVVPS